jgi:hypothetical protein
LQNNLACRGLSGAADFRSRKLWKAKHAQATNELLILGRAVRNLMATEPRWIKHQISQMKVGSIGEHAGAAFEIIGLDLFAGPGLRIVPASANKPGYDGSVVFDDGSSLMVSIKNHGITSHEVAFLSKAEEMRAAFVDSLRKAQANPGRMTATLAAVSFRRLLPAAGSGRERRGVRGQKEVVRTAMIRDDERRRRESIFRNAAAIGGFEGSSPSEHLLALAQMWFDDEITVQELCDRIVAHHARTQ